MFRALRLLLVPALMLVVTAAAWAGPACDSEKASTDQATVAPASSGCAAKAATTAQAGVCAGKTASASAGECAGKSAGNADCVYCAFTDQLKASKGSVTVTTVPTEHGVRLVFAGVTTDDVQAAQVVAAKAYAMMNAPAHCSMSRAKMASESCEGCKAGLSAFANASVTLEDTDSGAEAVVSVKDDKQVDEVVAFFAHFQTAGESNKG